MSYQVITKINGVEQSSKKFGGVVNNAQVVTCKPKKHYDYNYYYFVIDGRPIKAKKGDVMTIEAVNI